MSVNSSDVLWVIFLLERTDFALESTFVREMVPLQRVTPIPKAPPHIRGIINLRGKTMPAVDLRVLFGLPSLQEESQDLVKLMNQREQDHKNWLNELEASVRETREFKLATDPHKCAFGKWYDTFKTDNSLLSSVLHKFDAPHKAIHGIAEHVLAANKRGDSEEAHAIIERTRSRELSAMLDLFEQLRQMVVELQRELALVLEVSGIMFAATVDSVESVESLGNTVIEAPEMAGGAGQDIITRIGRRTKNNTLVLIPAIERVMAAADLAAVAAHV